MLYSCSQKKKKTKTVVEKYWDWELTNETQPIWVRIIYVIFVDIIMILYMYFQNCKCANVMVPVCAVGSFGTLKRFQLRSTMNFSRKPSMSTWILWHPPTSLQRYVVFAFILVVCHFFVLVSKQL